MTEYVVRVPSESKKQFHVMRFSSALNVSINDFSNCKMERENLFKDVKEDAQELPEFGAGSEYGRKEREEARRRRFEKRKNRQNNSPWILKIGGKQGKKYKGNREGGVSENTSYYVFCQAPDGAFEAYPINEWYNFTPFQRYKALSAEEAEEKFNKRDQILNYFPLKLMNKAKQGDNVADEAGGNTSRSIKKEFKVSDMDDWYNSDNENLSHSDDDQDEDKSSKKGKNKKGKKSNKKIKKSDSDNDEEPMEDSDEGDYDDKEVDYMSDTSSSSESENEKADIKGVIDESALRDLVVSEDEEEQEENKEENNEQTENDKADADKKVKIKSEKNGNDSSISDSDFDSDNSDLDVSKSALFIPNKKDKKVKNESDLTGESNNEPSKSGSSVQSGSFRLKHKLESASSSSHVSKKQKVDRSSNETTDIVTEDAVRRYLMRKPMTCAELLQKFKSKVQRDKQNRDKLVAYLSDVLKKLAPEQEKRNGKQYLFIKPK